MATIRFIHSADLHLGSPFVGMKGLGHEQWKYLEDSTLTAFDRLIARALETRPDFVLIAGDIYDEEERNLRAQQRFQKRMETLEQANIPVFVSHGNHDHLGGSGAAFELPDNVHVFKEQVENIELTVRGATVRIAGFSYGRRHVTEAVIESYPEGQPGIVQIGMLHGSEASNTEHAVYAPFRKEQLLSKNYDYWALGHIHKRQCLSHHPPIVYPGNLQGRHRKEAGPKGFYEVTLADGHADLQFMAVETVRFEQLDIDCSEVRHMNELFALCSEQVRTHEAEGLIAHITLCGLEEQTARMLEEIPESELLETMREAVEGNGRFIHIAALSIEYAAKQYELSPFGKQIARRLESWRSEEWKQALQELYNHPQSGRFLPLLDDELQQELRTAAELKIRKLLALEDRA